MSGEDQVQWEMNFSLSCSSYFYSKHLYKYCFGLRYLLMLMLCPYHGYKIKFETGAEINRWKGTQANILKFQPP